MPRIIAKTPASRGMNIRPEHIARMSRVRANVTFDHSAALAPYTPPPGVLPKGRKIATDSALPAGMNAWAGNGLYNYAFQEGYTFLGYAYLSELAQVPEYRLISQVIATEMTRKWIKIQCTDDEGDEKAGKIKELEAEFDRLNVRAHFKLAALNDGFFGRSHIFVDTGDNRNPLELAKPLSATAGKLDKGFLRKLKSVEPIWAYPSNYNANDPLEDDWYNPTQWFVMAKEVHQSRFLTFVGRPVPDMLKPSFAFGGLSRTQMAKPVVDNWLSTRANVGAIIRAFSVFVLKTDLSTLLQGDGVGLEARAMLFNAIRNNAGLMMLNKDSEDFANVSAPLGSLDKLQAQSQEHICSNSQLPLVKYTGISPSGLNASSEGEIQCFYDVIHAEQESFFDPHLQTIFKLAQLNIWGEIDPDLTYEYEPLWELSAEQLANKRKTEADTDAALIDKGVLSPEESRQRIADDPASAYSSLDVDDLPEPEEPEPEHIRETTTKKEGEASSVKVKETGPKPFGNDSKPRRKKAA